MKDNGVQSNTRMSDAWSGVSLVSARELLRVECVDLDNAALNIHTRYR